MTESAPPYDLRPAATTPPSEGARNGRADDIGTLLAAHYADVWALCYRLTDSRDAADDLAQETFLRVLRYRDTYRGQSAFGTWLYRLARNVCLDYFKTGRREHALAGALSLEAHTTGPAQPLDPDDGRAARLRHALALLPAADRELLILSRFHGLPYAQLAEVLNTTPGAARVRAHRALRALRDHYVELERRDHGV